MKKINYTANENDLYENFNYVLPEGEYEVKIIDTDIYENKNKNGDILKIVYQILIKPFTGRKIFDFIVISHPNEMAVRIGRQKLNTLCKLASIGQLKETPQLHGTIIKLFLGIKELNGEKQNFIKKYLIATAMVKMEEKSVQCPSCGSIEIKPGVCQHCGRIL